MVTDHSCPSAGGFPRRERPADHGCEFRGGSRGGVAGELQPPSASRDSHMSLSRSGSGRQTSDHKGKPVARSSSSPPRSLSIPCSCGTAGSRTGESPITFSRSWQPSVGLRRRAAAEGPGLRAGPEPRGHAVGGIGHDVAATPRHQSPRPPWQSGACGQMKTQNGSSPRPAMRYWSLRPRSKSASTSATSISWCWLAHLQGRALYLQRIGRAGRRTGGSRVLVVPRTMAERAALASMLIAARDGRLEPEGRSASTCEQSDPVASPRRPATLWAIGGGLTWCSRGACHHGLAISPKFRR